MKQRYAPTHGITGRVHTQTHTAPQAQYMGHTLSLQERARVLRLALTHLQKLVKAGSLHPAAHMTRCGALIPLGGLTVCGLNTRRYFTCRHKMIGHIHTLAQYCEAAWITRSHTASSTPPPGEGV